MQAKTWKSINRGSTDGTATTEAKSAISMRMPGEDGEKQSGKRNHASKLQSLI
jgi:hypothetical protein